MLSQHRFVLFPSEGDVRVTCLTQRSGLFDQYGFPMVEIALAYYMLGIVVFASLVGENREMT